MPRAGRRRGRWRGPGRLQRRLGDCSARSIDAGTSGLGVCVTLGNWPSGVICSSTGVDAEALLGQAPPGRHGADAVQRREDDLDLVVLRRRHQALLAAQIDVGLVRLLIEEVDAAAARASGQGSALIVRHLIDEVGHDLVVGRHRLAAALVVELAAVVVGRIVRRRDVEAAVALELADGERQLRRGQVARGCPAAGCRRGCRWRRRRRRRAGRRSRDDRCSTGLGRPGCSCLRWSSKRRTS